MQQFTWVESIAILVTVLISTSLLVGVSCAGRGKCESKLSQNFRGKPFTNSLADQAQAASRSGIVQVVRSGDAATADFRDDRLTIIIDRKTGLVLKLFCG